MLIFTPVYSKLQVLEKEGDGLCQENQLLQETGK